MQIKSFNLRLIVLVEVKNKKIEQRRTDKRMNMFPDGLVNLGLEDKMSKKLIFSTNF